MFFSFFVEMFQVAKLYFEMDDTIVIFSQERHQILQEMGISVQDTGIAVEKGRYYLVNLNADPSLNEMLVYYLKVTVLFL